jgi:hypothetical protein
MGLENFVIQGASDTFFTPSVNFNAETGYCIVSGESYLENTVEFYEKLYAWMKEFFKTGKPIEFDFKLTYYNTSSNKAILQLMNLLKDYENDGKSVKASWHYKEEDTEMLEEAEDFMLDSGLDLKIVADL